MHLSPGQVIGELFTYGEIATYFGKARSTVWRWAQPEPKGTGGSIPARYHKRLLEYAKSQKVKLTPADLVHGREVPE